MNRYDWSKLDAGWEERAGELRWQERGTVYPFFISVLERQPDDYRPDRGMVDSVWCDLYPEARAQLAKCRIRDTERAPVDNTPLFEAMDRMAEEVPKEEWVPFVVATSQPWRRGPLASWTLVNISCHDGRLTVVMKRGRGELVMETGPDDEVLWERLAQKAESYTT